MPQGKSKVVKNRKLFETLGQHPVDLVEQIGLMCANMLK